MYYKVKFKKVQEGSQRFEKVLNSKIRFEKVHNVQECQRIHKVLINSCFGWVVNEEGYGMIALSID